MTKERKQQFTLRITQANSTELVVILYEMMLGYLDDADTALEAEDQAKFKSSIHAARGCLNELIQSLNLKYEPAPGLLQLYIYCMKKLAHSEVCREKEGLEHIRKVIVPLHDAYEQIAGQNTSGPVMGNSQTVFAGLTYGRNTLTENMADQGTDRGMRI